MSLHRPKEVTLRTGPVDEIRASLGYDSDGERDLVTRAVVEGPIWYGPSSYALDERTDGARDLCGFRSLFEAVGTAVSFRARGPRGPSEGSILAHPLFQYLIWAFGHDDDVTILVTVKSEADFFKFLFS